VYVDELRRREKELGIEPDPEVDALLKAVAVEGKRSNLSTDLMLRILGLEVSCSAVRASLTCCQPGFEILSGHVWLFRSTRQLQDTTTSLACCQPGFEVHVWAQFGCSGLQGSCRIQRPAWHAASLALRFMSGHSLGVQVYKAVAGHNDQPGMLPAWL